MNKKVVVTAIVIVLLLVVGGALIMSTRNKPATTVTTSGTQTNKAQEKSPPVAQKSLKDLLAAGIPQKCTYKDVSGQTNVTGTTYIANGKVRGDFTSTIEGKTTTGHTIYDGKTSYIWTDGTTSGFKMEIDPSTPSASESSTPSTQQGLDLNKTIDYSCGVWIADQSLFNPPSDITFNTFAIPSPSAEGSTTGNQNLCSTCDSLTGAQKTQCLTALKCN